MREVPKDLGQRIVETAGLAARLHAMLDEAAPAKRPEPDWAPSLSDSALENEPQPQLRGLVGDILRERGAR